MSASNEMSKTRLALAVSFALWQLITPAQAWPLKMSGEITTPFTDPLGVRPPLLDTGKTLPGDKAPMPCAQSYGPAHSATADVLNVLANLTLTQAVDLALCNNPQVKGAWAAIKVQSAGLGEAKAAYLPTVNAGVSQIRDRIWYPNAAQPGPAATVLSGTTVNTSLSWRLLDFGGRAANAASASALLDAALASHDAALQKTLAGVIGAYFDAQTAAAALTARQKIEALSRQTLETATRRESRGAGAQSDTLQAATAQAKANLEQTRAQGAFQKSLAVLVSALGLNLSMASNMILANELEEPESAFEERPGVWLDQARLQHPTILAAKAQLASAKSKVTVAQSDGMPTLDLTGNFYQNGRPNQGLPTLKTREALVGVAVNIPLFDGFGRTYKVRGAQATVEQREAELQDAEQQILTEVVKTHADALSALGNLRSSLALITAAQAATASVQRKFVRGAADILEILSTQSAQSDAQQERIRCLAEWRSARLRLLAAVGVLGREGL